jgi:hypothetical protein
VRDIEYGFHVERIPSLTALQRLTNEELLRLMIRSSHILAGRKTSPEERALITATDMLELAAKTWSLAQISEHRQALESATARRRK